MQSPSEIMSAAVLTVSDSASRGERSDSSGPAIVALLKTKGFNVGMTQVVADDEPVIEEALLRLTGQARLVVTTGGTGIAARDVTPEATRRVCTRLIEGVSERMRAEGAKKTPFAVLSRAVCGVRDKSVILNLPGSPAGAVDSLASVIDILPHIVQLLAGNTKHE
jgi:molybdopterin adenylyltransferase